MEIYLLTVLIIFITSFIAQFSSENYNDILKTFPKNYFVFLTAVILILVAGLRWNVGTDYVQYAINYSSYSTTFWESLVMFNEPGIKFISYISRLINGDYGTMFFLSSLITVGLIIWTLSKYSNSFFLSVLLYVFLGSWHESFNIIRQYLACAIVFSGHIYIIRKDFFKYSLVVLLATSFHQSAVFMMLLYFIPQKKLSLKSIIGLLLIAIVALQSYEFIFGALESFFEIRDKSYVVTNYVLRNINPLRVAVASAPVILYLLLYRGKDIINEDYFYINVLFINFIVLLVSSNSAYLARFAIYTNLFVSLGLPRVLKYEYKKNRIFVQSLILFFYFIYWFYEVSRTANLVNFQWIFNR